IAIRRKNGVMVEDILGNQRLALAGFFHRLIEQDMVVYHNADIPGKNEIRDRWENHLTFIGRTTEKHPCQRSGRVCHQLALYVKTTRLNSTYRSDQLALYRCIR